MRKNALQVAAERMKENGAEIRNYSFIDSYFESGFSCDVLGVSFSFTDDNSRILYRESVKAINKMKAVSVICHNSSRFGAYIEIAKASDAEPLNLINSESFKSSEDFNNVRHSLIISGVPEDEQKSILDMIQNENKEKFLKLFRDLQAKAA